MSYIGCAGRYMGGTIQPVTQIFPTIRDFDRAVQANHPDAVWGEDYDILRISPEAVDLVGRLQRATSDQLQLVTARERDDALRGSEA